MGQINIDELKKFVSLPVEIAIIDEQSTEPPIYFTKTVNDIKICPDGTHMRIYFNHVSFFAIPLISTVVNSKEEWEAYDQTAGLYYVIREGQSVP